MDQRLENAFREELDRKSIFEAPWHVLNAAILVQKPHDRSADDPSHHPDRHNPASKMNPLNSVPRGRPGHGRPEHCPLPWLARFKIFIR